MVYLHPTKENAMKMTVTLQLEVDAAGWSDDYGVEGASSIRGDVKSWLRTLVQESSDNIAKVVVK